MYIVQCLYTCATMLRSIPESSVCKSFASTTLTAWSTSRARAYRDTQGSLYNSSTAKCPTSEFAFVISECLPYLFFFSIFRRLCESPRFFPTCYPEDLESLPEEEYADNMHNFDDPSINFTWSVLYEWNILYMLQQRAHVWVILLANLYHS